MAIISEKELVLPSLYVLSLQHEGFITTAQLIHELELLLQPSGEDIKILTGRTDTKFSQKVRNLISHRTLDGKGVARYIEERAWSEITEFWKAYLQTNKELIEYLMSDKFSNDEKKEAFGTLYDNIYINTKIVELFDESIVITEWTKKYRYHTVYERSSQLRDVAIQHFSRDGILYCEACNFSFNLFYGEELAQNYIEIHHKIPIFQYEGDQTEHTIHDALENVCPLCSNCHRMVHKKRNESMEIEAIKEYIHSHWVFHMYD